MSIGPRLDCFLMTWFDGNAVNVQTHRIILASVELKVSPHEDAVSANVCIWRAALESAYLSNPRARLCCEPPA